MWQHYWNYWSIICLVALTGILLAADVVDKRNYRIILSGIDCPPLTDTRVVTFYNCSLVPYKTEIESNYVNADVVLARDIRKAIVLLTLTMESNGRQIEYSRVPLNLCETLRILPKIDLMRAFSLELRRSSNLPLKCPYKKNFNYYLRNHNSDFHGLPGIFPAFNWTMVFEFWVENKHIVNCSTYGRYIKYNPVSKQSTD